MDCKKAASKQCNHSIDADTISVLVDGFAFPIVDRPLDEETFVMVGVDASGQDLVIHTRRRADMLT